MYKDMAILIVLIFIAALQCNARVLFSHGTNDLSNEQITRRQDSPNILHTFDLKNDFAPRDILLEADRYESCIMNCFIC